MKISIITVCYNSEKTISDTFDSVLKQKYKNYEYIVVDGKSTDNTMSIIKKYQKKFNSKKIKMIVISEKDEGLYDAMNKGIRIASGDLVGIINSDDILFDDEVFNRISMVDLKKYEGCYSDLILTDYGMNKIKTYFKAKPRSYLSGWYPPHPTLYLKKDIFDKYGYYNQEYCIAADYDFTLRILKNKVNLSYIPMVNVCMREGGASTGNIKKYHEGNKEIYSIFKSQGFKFPLLLTTIRFVSEIIKKFKSLFHKSIKKINKR